MTDPLPRVVVADPIDMRALEPLRHAPCELIDATKGEAALSESLPGAWALIVRSRTRVSAEMIGRAPKLSLIARAGVGVDNIDVTAATARRIRVVNAPAAATASVAELSVALYLMLARDLYPRIAKTKSGDWQRSGNGSELSGKTVGFVGYGRIAREIAKRLAPFGTVTIAYDPYVKSSGDATALVGLEDVLARSDFLSVHAAATEENQHLINGERLSRMKKGAYLVNVARGSLVDEVALIRALDSGALAGAALDVFEVEPPTRKELLAHPKVIATPHLGASTHEAQARAGKDTVDEVLRALRGEPLTALVNPLVPGGQP
ncbi:MAG: hydroxyacid dehydrogenase [Thermoplasmata archaeon]|nr:hydroxyacid dehydrogenase [Thermoplasmata archaeon]